MNKQLSLRLIITFIFFIIVSVAVAQDGSYDDESGDNLQDYQKPIPTISPQPPSDEGGDFPAQSDYNPGDSDNNDADYGGDYGGDY